MGVTTDRLIFFVGLLACLVSLARCSPRTCEVVPRPDCSRQAPGSLHPHERGCSLFYRCDELGAPRAFACPSGRRFSAHGGEICAPEARVPCTRCAREFIDDDCPPTTPPPCMSSSTEAVASTTERVTPMPSTEATTERVTPRPSTVATTERVTPAHSTTERVSTPEAQTSPQSSTTDTEDITTEFITAESSSAFF